MWEFDILLFRQNVWFAVVACLALRDVKVFSERLPESLKIKKVRFLYLHIIFVPDWLSFKSDNISPDEFSTLETPPQ